MRRHLFAHFKAKTLNNKMRLDFLRILTNLLLKRKSVRIFWFELSKIMLFSSAKTNAVRFFRTGFYGEAY